MIIDTHCHYNLEPLFSANGTKPEAWKDYWQEAQNHQVQNAVIVGTTLETSQTAINLAQTEPAFKATVGIHPMHVANVDLPSAADQLTNMLKPAKADVVAIGEVGLDYFRLKSNDTATKIDQQKLFTIQISLAIEYALPLVLHVRDQQSPETPTPGNAYWDVLELIQKHHRGQTPLILHCVSGPQSYVKHMLELGAYIGVAGNISYKSAENLRQLVKLAPAEKLLLETDAPYLPPQEHRGNICQPWMISLTAEYVEQTLSISQTQLKNNTLDLFDSFPKG